MRAAAEIRERFLDEFSHAVSHPSMWPGEPWFRGRLTDLAFIDGREDELRRCEDDLRRAKLLSSIGVAGWFSLRFDLFGAFSDEVASIYARIADLFGWFAPKRRLDRASFARARTAAHSLAAADCSAADVQRRLGPPSVVAGDVHAYAGVEPREGWIFFDYDFVPQAPGQFARADAPPECLRLRNVRLPRDAWYSERVRYTPLGRRSRI